MLMVSKTSKNKNLTKTKTFIKDAKSGKFGAVEKSSIKYARMSATAEPFENKTHPVTYFGIR